MAVAKILSVFFLGKMLHSHGEATPEASHKIKLSPFRK